MIRPILQLGNPLLRMTSLPVHASEPSVQETWKDLTDTLNDIMQRHVFRNSAGISAVQIGVLQRLCLVWTPEKGFIYLANPEIVSQTRGEASEFEGCLSFFDKRGRVARPVGVQIRYFDQKFDSREGEFSNWGARIILHEMDHMNGVLYTDRMAANERVVEYKDYLKFVDN